MNVPTTQPSRTCFVASAVELRLRRGSRRLVLGSGWLLLLIGLVLALNTPFSPALRLLLAVTWLCVAGFSLARQAVGFNRARRLLLRADGTGAALNGGRQRPVEVVGGSPLPRNALWLRLRFDDGLVHGELIRAADTDPAVWRRLLVLWRFGLRPQ